MVPTPEDLRLRERGLCLVTFQRQEAFVQTVAERLQIETAHRESKCAGCQQTVCVDRRRWDHDTEFLTHGLCEFCCRDLCSVASTNLTCFTDEGLSVVRLYLCMKRRRQAYPTDRGPMETTLQVERLILATLDDSLPVPVYLRRDER